MRHTFLAVPKYKYGVVIPNAIMWVLFLCIDINLYLTVRKLSNFKSSLPNDKCLNLIMH